MPILFRLGLLICANFIGLYVHSQSVYTGEYRSESNPYYWKNKTPKPGYWQQDVNYKILASIGEKSGEIAATETLTYWNNSTDTLHDLYFHLYQNAFIEGSYLQDLNNTNKVKPKYGKYEAQGLGTIVSNLQVNQQPVSASIDNTIMKVSLADPLYPNQSVVVTMEFKTYFDHGSNRRRMKSYDAWGWQHFNGVHWYPRICVYDMRKGWDLDQHLNKELYGDFGTFDVSLEFANNYIVDATGLLQNQDEVLPPELRTQLDVKNFKNKPWDEAPSEVIEYNPSIRKTWNFRAVNVHDFAFTADPSYRIVDTIYKDVVCRGLVQEPHASKWQNSAEFVRKIIQLYSEDFGDYVYPKMIAADAADGMEYPMLTLDGGGEPGFHGLLAHEIGHNWFFGMIGSNETYRAALDEGFTQFLTGWSMTKLFGDTVISYPTRSHWLNKTVRPSSYRFNSVYGRVVTDWLDGNLVTMNRHSNDYHSALGHENGYGQVYYKPATMLYNLQYVLGDSLFLACMKHYVSQWKIAHPYMTDFRQAVRDVAKVDMDWFFDQWIESEKKLDYRIIKAKSKNGQLIVKLGRREEMTSPLDITVYDVDNNPSFIYIPNTDFQKQTNANILPKWYGWEKLNPTYTISIPYTSRLRGVSIDPSDRMTDETKLNNSKYKTFLPKEKYDWKFDSHLSSTNDYTKYLLDWRPDVWWNRMDGFKIGLHLQGNYLKRLNVFSLTAWYNTGWLAPNHSSLNLIKNKFLNYNFSYNTEFAAIPRFQLKIKSAILEGLYDEQIGGEYNTLSNWQFTGNFRMMKRYDQSAYLIYPFWSLVDFPSLRPAWNSYIEAKAAKRIRHFNGYSDLYGRWRTSAQFFNKPVEYTSPYSFADIQWKRVFDWKKFQFKSRLYGRISSADYPLESALMLGGANNEEMMDNKFYRSNGFMSNDYFKQGNHVQMGGGLNLRAFVGDINFMTVNGQSIPEYYANNGLSWNIEIDFDQYFNWKPKAFRQWLHIDTYVFSDLGLLSNFYDFSYISPIKADAGLGTAWTIKKFWKLIDIHPLTIRFDMPFYKSVTSLSSPNPWAYRSIIGINRCF